MRIERHKNFLTQAECSALNAWADLGVQNKWLDVGFSKGVLGTVNRVTSRLYPGRFKYPQFVHDISNKIRIFCGVGSYGLIEGHGRDGIVVSCTFTGGDVYAHKDPVSEKGLATLRCNIMTRAPDAGCVLHVGGQVVDIEAGELHCYLASEHEHFATPVEGNTSRIMWMFGAHVPAQDWDGGLIKFGAN
jgi:hypothetical protein